MRYKNLIIALVIIVIIAAVYFIIRAQSSGNSQTADSGVSFQPPAPTSQTGGIANQPVPADNSGTPPAVPPPTAAVKTVNVSGTEFAFSPNSITVSNNLPVKIVFTNNGKYPHNWTIDEFGAKTATISPGQTTEVTFTPNKTGTFQFYCSVPGHKDQGMAGSLTVN